MSQDAVYDLMQAAARRKDKDNSFAAGRKRQDVVLGVFGNLFFIFVIRKGPIFAKSRSTRKHDDVDTEWM